ncbi:MAG TPA: hypothetical protein VHG72_02740 [Polyangia bacterium]|nr:hypothetical protein [Polyangia bacterium]
MLLGGKQSMKDYRVRLTSIVSLKESPTPGYFGYLWPAALAVPRDGNAPRDLFPLVAQ